MNTSTTSDASIMGSIVVLPLGAFEQHGPHLPLHTDTLIIEAVVAAAMEHPAVDAGRFFVAPTIPITASDEHAGFPGGLSSGTDALVATVVSICRSAAWARGVCIVNGHGGNADALRQIGSALEWERLEHAIWSLPAYAGGDMHAGLTETSLLLHLAPHLVRIDHLESGATNLGAADFTAMRTGGIKSVSANGILGDPRGATAAHGRDVLAMYRDSMVEMLTTAAATWPRP